MKPAAAVLLAALLCSSARAIAAPADIELTVSTPRAEVGRPFQLKLTALSEGESPHSPEVVVPPELQLRGPSLGTQQQVSIAGGRIQHRRGLTATWTVVAAQPGRYTMGPATVVVDGEKHRSQAVTVEIVAPGTIPAPAPRRRRRFQGWPFDVDPHDPFGFDPSQLLPGFPGLDDADDPSLPRLAPTYPEEMQVDEAPDPVAFLRATAAPTHAVVGEQVLLQVHAYGRHGRFRESHTSEPSRTDFLSHTIVDTSYRQPFHRVSIDDSVWYAVKVRELALFPIRAGRLTIGPMQMGFEGPAYARGPRRSSRGGTLMRASQPVDVVVTEPPLEGRPPGYQLGDVGRFSVKANVSPRSVTAGEAVSVEVRLEGTGNLPARPKLPELPGVSWLEPIVKESTEIRDATVGGWRRLTYVVELARPGQVNLGEITLPYYDPARRAYAVARAPLGVVEVAPNPAAGARRASAEASHEDEPLAELLAPRATLGPPATSTLRLTDSRRFWLLLAVGPLGVILATGAAQGGARLRACWKARGHSQSSVAADALRQARIAASQGDGAGAASAVERALYAGIEARTGQRARPVLRDQLSEWLGNRGLKAEIALEVVSVLEACDTLRIGAAHPDEPQRIIERASTVLQSLTRGARRWPGKLRGAA